jgi:hypothetical protein
MACDREDDVPLGLFNRSTSPPALPKAFAGRRGAREATCPKCALPSHTLLCPHCHNEVPNDVCQFRRSLTFGLIGPQEAGKSHYIAVLIHALRKRDFCIRFDCSFSSLGDDTDDRYKSQFHDPLFEHRQTLDATASVLRDKRGRLPLLYCLKFPASRLRRLLGKEFDPVFMSFYDTAGEDLLSQNLVDSEVRYISNSSGLVLLLDPLQFDSVRGQVSDPSILPKKWADPQALIERVARVILAQRGGSQERRIDTPLAITFTKIDSLKPPILYPGAAVLREARHEGALDLDGLERLQAELRSYVAQWLGPGFDQWIRQTFKEFAYFGISALGCAPDAAGRLPQPVNPLRIEDPLVWLLWRNGLVDGRKGAS